MAMSFLNKMQYIKANTEQDSESQENLLSEEESHPSRPEKTTKKWRQGFLMLLYIIGTALACLAAGLVGYNWERDMNGVCIRHISEPSPLQSKVTFHEQDFNGSFLKETAFRKDPSPETDAVWSSIGTDYRPVRISSEDARKAGIPHDYVKIDEKYGGGHPVSIEGFHHLHCLNLLRQALYYNYEHYRDLGQGAFMNEEFIVKRHVTHCLDILRQQLMCSVDVGVFGQVWIYPDNPEPFVDFNTQHRCRNFEQLRQWAELNQLPKDVPPDFLQRPREGDRIYSGVP